MCNHNFEFFRIFIKMEDEQPDEKRVRFDYSKSSRQEKRPFYPTTSSVPKPHSFSQHLNKKSNRPKPAVSLVVPTPPTADSSFNTLHEPNEGLFGCSTSANVEFSFIDAQNVCCGLCGEIVPFNELLSVHLPNSHVTYWRYANLKELQV